MRRLATTLFAVVVAFAAMLVGSAGALACLMPPPFDGQIDGFRLVAGPSGDSFVAWSEYRRNADDVERAAALSGGAWTWAEPGGVPGPDTQGLPGYAAVSEAGAVAVWQQNQGIVAASRVGAGALGQALVIADESGSPPWGFQMDPRVSLGGAGHAVALWTRSLVEAPGSPMIERRVTRAADRAPDGTWSAPYDLAPAGAARQYVITSCGPAHSEPPAIAVDAAGNAVAAWETWLPEPTQTVTMWASRPLGGAWSAPTVFTSGRASSVQLALDAAGTAHAAWVEGGNVRSTRRPAGGAFGPAETIGHAIRDVQLEVDAAGRSVAVWQASHTKISAATRPADGTWSAPVDLTALEEPTIGPRPPDRSALLHEVRISRATMRQPVCAVRKGPARRACRASGAALTFRLSALAEVRVTVQRRGRGKALRGLRLAAGAGKHRVVVGARPLPPGRYTVRIRVTAEGRAPEVATKQLVVRPA